ncbi:MAG: hypothetical protein ACK559_30095, partial [bacterium]
DVVAVAHGDEQILQRLAGPEHLLEAVIGGVHAPHGEEFLDDDGPAPHRSRGKPQHNQLDDPARLHDEMPERDFAPRNRRHCKKRHPALPSAARPAAARPSAAIPHMLMI